MCSYSTTGRASLVIEAKGEKQRLRRKKQGTGAGAGGQRLT